VTTASGLAVQVRGRVSARFGLDLAFGEFRVHVATNSARLRGLLRKYFEPFSGPSGPADLTVTALQMHEPDLELDYRDWPRDPGKAGVKDSFVDLPDGRVCRKVKTGMQYLLTGNERLVFGDCLAHRSQVINFVISQYMNWLIHGDWIPCHASAISYDGAGLAIGARSGGGKSTLALNLVAGGLKLASNDRTMIRSRRGHTRLNGVPKQPRINPGTVLNNPSLASVMPATRRRGLARLPADELRALEEKYDADVAAIFGARRFDLEARLDAMVILNWDWGSNAPPRFDRVGLSGRRDLLSAIMKPPGPFYLPRDGKPGDRIFAHAPEDYLAALATVPVFEVAGGVDFDAAAAGCRALLKATALTAA
jgi:HprK-related kinase B